MSIAPVVLRSNFSDLFSSSALPALEEMFRHNLQLQSAIRGQLFNMRSTDRDIWQASEMGDLQNFVQVNEGEDYTFVRPRAGANKTLTPLKYGLGVSFSEEVIEDGKFEFISDSVSKLAESAIDSQENAALNMFNNGFSTATTWDGVALFSASHTTPSGLSVRNKLSVDADLSQSSLDTMRSDFEKCQISDSGKYRMIKPRILLVHSDSRRYADELLNSSNKPDSMDNNLNSMKGEGLIVLSSPRLTDTDAWFMLGAAKDTGLQVISRKGIETKAAGPDAGFINDSIMYKSRYREIVGLTHYYGVFGTSGS